MSILKLKEKCKYEWKFIRHSLTQDHYESPLFSSEQRNFKYKLEFTIYQECQAAYVFLQIIDAPHKRIDICYDLLVMSKCFTDLQMSMSTYFKYLNSMEPVKILITSFRGRILQDVSFLLEISIIASCTCIIEDLQEAPKADIEAQIPSNYQELTSPKMQQFEQMLQSLLNDPDFSDLKIKVGSEELDVHKCVLAVTSSVFRAELARNMLEKNSGCIEIKDFKMNVVQLMINFLYKRDINIPDYKCALELLKISDYYDVQDLKKFCEEYLKKTTTKDNVLEICLSAEINNNEDLKRWTMNYFLENIKICRSSNFKEIAKLRPELMIEFISKMTEKLAKA